MIEFDAVFGEKFNVLFFKRLPLVLFFLMCDVIFARFRQGLAYGKRTVSALPFKSAWQFVLFIDPSRGIRLEQLNRLRYRKFRMDTQQQVDMDGTPVVALRLIGLGFRRFVTWDLHPRLSHAVASRR